MKTILLIFLFILIINWLIRSIFPILMRKVIKNMQKQYGYDTTPKKKQKEGEIVIDNIPPSQPKETEKIGSYVDYEEIK